MLLNFTVSNFTSFGRPMTFSMEGGRTRGKRDHLAISRYARTLKFAALYGSNAAGKSNFIKAMDFACQVVVNQGKIPGGYTTCYNRSNPENAKRPSTFEFEILLNRKRYTYGFSIVLTSLTFVGEWLYETTNVKKTLFLRSFDEKSILLLPLKGEAKKRVQYYFNDILDDHETLFLHEMNRKKDELYKEQSSIIFLKDIFNWLAHKIVFIYPQGGDFKRYSFTLNADKEKLFQQLEAFGLDITDYTYESTSFDRVFSDVPDVLRKELRSDIERALAERQRDEEKGQDVFLFTGQDLCSFGIDEDGKVSVKIVKTQHGKWGSYLLSEESDGTRRILELVEVLLSDSQDTTYIIDEIDRSMHPLLTDAFIAQYLSNLSNRDVQLIITTHESRLLSTNRLRRDEVWFSDKKDGETSIWRFDHMEDTEETGALKRGDIKIEAAYLNGRYGAIPKLISHISEEEL